MSNQVAQSNQGMTLKGFFSQDSVKSKFAELLGKKSTGFITSVMQVVSNNKLLAKADMNSIYQAAAMAATLDLIINNNLGHAWIVPYGDKAQFQIGWKGFVQLAQRSGQYKRINVVSVYENQFESWNELTEELIADFNTKGEGKIIGYVAYFQLLNGFEKTNFWFRERAEAHGRRFSKSFSSGPWKDDFDAMAMKTVLKSTLSKWGPLSIELQKALSADQSIIEDAANGSYSYEDNDNKGGEPTLYREELARAILLLNDLHTENEINEFVFSVITEHWSEGERATFNEEINKKKLAVQKK
jgi:recombination protein RecT